MIRDAHETRDAEREGTHEKVQARLERGRRHRRTRHAGTRGLDLVAHPMNVAFEAGPEAGEFDEEVAASVADALDHEPALPAIRLLLVLPRAQEPALLSCTGLERRLEGMELAGAHQDVPRPERRACEGRLLRTRPGSALRVRRESTLCVHAPRAIPMPRGHWPECP